MTKAKAQLDDMPAVMPCDVCGTDVDISDAVRVVRARRALCYDHQSAYTQTVKPKEHLLAAPSFDELLAAIDAYNRDNPATELQLNRVVKTQL